MIAKGLRTRLFLGRLGWLLWGTAAVGALVFAILGVGVGAGSRVAVGLHQNWQELGVPTVQDLDSLDAKAVGLEHAACADDSDVCRELGDLKIWLRELRGDLTDPEARARRSERADELASRWEQAKQWLNRLRAEWMGVNLF